MSRFSTRWGKHVAVTAVCLMSLCSFAMSSAAAQADEAVIISDSFNRKSANRKSAPKNRRGRADRQVRPTACSSGCNSGCCDAGLGEGFYGTGCDSGCGIGCDSGYNTGCDSGSCGSCCRCLPWWAHRSSFSGEFLYLHATDADVAHAQQQNGIGGAGTVPFGSIGKTNSHHEPAVRLALNKALTDCTSLSMSYTFFESDSLDTLEPPIIPGGGGAVGSFVHHPGASITASAGPVNAAYDIDFQLADVVFRSLWKGNDCYAVNWSVGGRYGNLVQEFQQLGVYAGGSAGIIETRSEIDFHGGGLMFGLDGERRIGCRGFSVYSRGNLSALSGRFHADYRLNNNTTDVLLAAADWQDDRIVTMLELEAGLSWTGAQGKWRSSAGYLTSFWFNTVTTSEFINTVQANSYDGVDDTLKFEGLTARIERRW